MNLILRHRTKFCMNLVFSIFIVFCANVHGAGVSVIDEIWSPPSQCDVDDVEIDLDLELADAVRFGIDLHANPSVLRELAVKRPEHLFAFWVTAAIGHEVIQFSDLAFLRYTAPLSVQPDKWQSVLDAFLGDPEQPREVLWGNIYRSISPDEHTMSVGCLRSFPEDEDRLELWIGHGLEVCQALEDSADDWFPETQVLPDSAELVKVILEKVPDHRASIRDSRLTAPVYFISELRFPS